MVYMINIYIESKELVKLQAPSVKLQKSQKLKFPEKPELDSKSMSSRPSR